VRRMNPDQCVVMTRRKNRSRALMNSPVLGLVDNNINSELLTLSSIVCKEIYILVIKTKQNGVKDVLFQKKSYKYLVQ